MNEIIVYDAEHQAGIAKEIKANASIILCASVKEILNVDESIKDQLLRCDLKSFASNRNQPDLYYLETILVSTGWNKNDDVFGPTEVWAARHSPEDKPFNLEHNELDIIGHITGSVAIDNNGDILKADLTVENLPDIFHLKTNAVLYRHWKDEEKQKRIETIIAEIHNGDWFVSMEALLNNFDYALIDKTTNAKKLVARTHDTAFLTKHLKLYGGIGEFQNYKIGRFLRGITFAGKGLVRKPANPQSIILVAEANVFNEQLSNLNSMENTVMSKELEVSELSKEIASLQKDLLVIKGERDEALAKLSKQDIEVVNAKIKSLEDTVATKDSEIKTLSTQAQELEAKVASINEDKAAIEAKYTEAKAAADKLAEEKAKMEKEKKTKARLDAVVAKGYKTEAAQSIIDKFNSLTDEQFESVVALASPGTDQQEDKKQNDSVDAANKALDAAKPEQASANLSDGSNLDKTVASETQGKLSNLFAEKLFKTTKAHQAKVVTK